MGGCVGRQREGTPHSRESSELSGAVGHNKPLKQRRPKWKSDVRLTEAQLQSKRDEFWDTAPAFEGRKEIWDALKACTVALEGGDHQLAQAILDGANISLPNGTLLECYDELGTRYQLPVYVLSPPINLLKEDAVEGAASSTSTDPTVSLDDLSSGVNQGVEVPIRVHLSTGRDCKLIVHSSDNVLSIKRQIHSLEGVEISRQRIYFAGRQLADRLRVEDAKIHKGYTLQVVVSEGGNLADQGSGGEKQSRKSNKSNLEVSQHSKFIHENSAQNSNFVQETKIRNSSDIILSDKRKHPLDGNILAIKQQACFNETERCNAMQKDIMNGKASDNTVKINIGSSVDTNIILNERENNGVQDERSQVISVGTLIS